MGTLSAATALPTAAADVIKLLNLEKHPEGGEFFH